LAWQSWSRSAAVALMAALAGCAPPGSEAPDPDRPMQLRFEDRPDPAAFEREGAAVRDAPKGAAGLWAAVPGLPRPERAVVVLLATGDEVEVALYRSAGSVIRLSGEAADALGIGAEPVRVRVTVLRRHPSLDTTSGRF
jgi:hypothetical protein